jgi:hypothetical protein
MGLSMMYITNPLRKIVTIIVTRDSQASEVFVALWRCGAVAAALS